MNPQQTQQIDQNVKNLVTAIGRTETAGYKGEAAYKARGASGEYGRYQFMPTTWDQWAKEAGVNSALEQSSIEDQNKVAYYKVKQLKDQGLSPKEIASIWNSGDKNSYTGFRSDGVTPTKGRITNSAGVTVDIDVPGYVQKVSQNYAELKNAQGIQYQPQQIQDQPIPGVGEQQPEEQKGYIQDVYGDVTGALNTAGGKLKSGFMEDGINPISGVWQAGGAVAGGVGDVIDTSLEHAPIVGGLYKGITDVIGGAVQGAMQTEPGQAALKWGQEHPEAAGNIGAGLDILSVFPFFKALKYGKQGIGDVTTGLASKKIEQGAVDELKSSLTQKPTRALDRAEGRGLDPMGTIVRDQNLLPEIVENNGRFTYSTTDAVKNAQRAVSADEKALQAKFAETMAKDPNSPGLSFNINDVAKNTIDDVMDSVGRTGGYDAIKTALTKYFDSYKNSMRGVEFINLSELNNIKRDVRKAINFDAIDPTGTLALEAKFGAGQSIMKQVENAAKKAGIKGVEDLNKNMANNLAVMDLLEFLNNRPIKAGIKSSRATEGLIKTGARFAGLDGLVDLIPHKSPLTPTKRLKNRRPLLETARKGIGKTTAGLVLSGQLGPSEE